MAELITSFAFYFLSSVTVLSALGVILVRNPVHSVLLLIMAFFNTAGLFILLGAEFLAMVLLIVYIGAVAVLFLFVVMMLDIDLAALRRGFLQYLPLGLVLGLVLLLELGTIFTVLGEDFEGVTIEHQLELKPTHTASLGAVLYTQYAHFFQLAGVILLVAMIGAIILTQRSRSYVKKQDPAQQSARGIDIETKNIKPGEGLPK